MSFDIKLQNGDVVLSNGDIKQVVDTEKLVQDILKITLTDIGSNPLYPWYGSSVSKSLIGSALPSNITLQIAQSQLQNSIENLKKMQSIQFNSYQKTTPDELISGILDILIDRNKRDLRLFTVNIRVLTQGLKPVQTSFNVTNI
jgi:hypothetical protein